MSESIITGLLWSAALGSGLMAGIYFSFSAFIMRAFDRLDTTQSLESPSTEKVRPELLPGLDSPYYSAATYPDGWVAANFANS